MRRVTLVAFLGLAVFVLWISWDALPKTSRPAAKSTSREPSIPGDPIPIGKSPVIGRSTARVAVIEFSEFQCPFCGKFARDTFPTLLREFVESGKVLWIFRDFPLQDIHPLALEASAAARCAGTQGHFMPMHNRLFAQPQRLASADLRQTAASVGVNLQQFEVCMGGDVESEITRSAKEARDVFGVDGTPTFLIGKLDASDASVQAIDRRDGAVPIGQLRDAINRVIARVK